MVSLFSNITPCYIDLKGRQSLLSVVICNLSIPEARNKMCTKLPTFGYETTGYEMTVVTKWPNTHPSWPKLGLWWLQEQKDQCSIKSYTVMIVYCFERLKRNQLTRVLYIFFILTAFLLLLFLSPMLPKKYWLYMSALSHFFFLAQDQIEQSRACKMGPSLPLEWTVKTRFAFYWPQARSAI